MEIRLIGTEEQVADAVRQIQTVFTVVQHSKPRPSKKNPEHVRVYLITRS